MTDSGSVHDLADGEHGCLTFSYTDEWLDILSVYVASSLERGRKVLCLTDALAPPALTAAVVERIPAASTERGLLIYPIRSDAGGASPGDATSGEATSGGLPAGGPAAGGLTSGEALIELVAEQLKAALAEGFRGLWLSLDMRWAAHPSVDVAALAGFEKSLGELAADRRGALTVLCHYDRSSFSAEKLDLAAGAHSPCLAAASYHHDAVLQISRPPGTAGLRIAGELDFGRLDPLVTALDETLRIDREVHLDLRHLRFVDVPTAYALIAAAGRMKAEQRMVVSGGQRIIGMLGQLGLTDVHKVRTRVSHERR
jgi:anti-anti-sigma regulatory factor